MKVLIDIPKSTYKDIKESYSITCGENFAQKLVKYIKNGTPLLKGHRFIDADEILNHSFIREGEDGDIFVQKYYCIRKEIVDNALFLFDTLEADKTKSEE